MTPKCRADPPGRHAWRQEPECRGGGPHTAEESLLAGALLSERIYFGLGALEKSGAGWVLTNIPGLEALPAASVCILDAATLDFADAAARTIGLIENEFASLRASRARFYAGETPPEFESLMEDKGYQRRTEIVHAFAPLAQAPVADQASGWRPVRSELDWAEKAAVHALPSSASDGYDAAPDQWLALERRKAETGKIEFWLFRLDGLAVATTGLIRLPQHIVRIKNFFVRADHRRRGVGTKALGNLLRQLPAAGEKAAVVLSVEGSIGQRLYESAGAREIGRIYEWSRAL